MSLDYLSLNIGKNIWLKFQVRISKITIFSDKKNKKICPSVDETKPDGHT